MPGLIFSLLTSEISWFKNVLLYLKFERAIIWSICFRVFARKFAQAMILLKFSGTGILAGFIK